MTAHVDERDKAGVLKEIVQTVADHDLAGAAEWTLSLPEGELRNAFGSFALTWAEADPRSAAEFMLKEGHLFIHDDELVQRGGSKW